MADGRRAATSCSAAVHWRWQASGRGSRRGWFIVYPCSYLRVQTPAQFSPGRPLPSSGSRMSGISNCLRCLATGGTKASLSTTHLSSIYTLRFTSPPGAASYRGCGPGASDASRKARSSRASVTRRTAAGRAHISRGTHRRAATTRAGPGKYSHSKACG